MGWLSESPESCFVLVLLIALWSAVISLALSRKPDARMNFLLRLIENIPDCGPFAPRAHEANPVRSKQGT